MGLWEANSARSVRLGDGIATGYGRSGSRSQVSPLAAEFDLWINFGQRIVETLLFYHPAVWWLSHRLRIDRELCCDEDAVRSTRNALRYAETLEHIARLVRISPSGCIGIRAADGVLLRRIRHLLGSARPQRRRRTWFAGMINFALRLS